MNDNLEGYKEKVKKAKDIVEELSLEEPYKTNAFNTILKNLLEKDNSSKGREEDKVSIKENTNILLNVEKIPYFDNFDKLNWKYKLLNILQWARHNHLEKGLLTSEFVIIFNERFGMPYIDSAKIGKEIKRRLLKTPLVTRRKINQRDFRWFITPKGEEYLKEK